MLLCAALLLISAGARAQDVSFDLTTGATASGDITLTYPANNVNGASVYYERKDFYSLKIKSSNRNIAHIEFEGKLSSSSKTANIEVANGNGTLTVKADGISRWDGSSTSIQFWGTEQATGYYISKLRIWYEGSPFTPTPDGGGQQETVDLGGSPKDVHHYAHPHTLPKDGKPVRMAFIYHSMFRETLQDYMLWKTQQGYDVVELCADEVNMETGKTGDELALELRSRLMAMQPRPAYVLLCGDTDEVPPFDNRTAMAGGQDPVTDFFYGEYTGDFFAEAYVGRYSAQKVEQLETQMNKTRYMAMIKPEEADWLHHSLVVHSPYYDIATDNSAAFGKLFPLQFEGNTSTEVRASQPSLVNQNINDGCSQVAYIGHGSQQYWWDAWGTNYTSTNVRSLTNKNKYPVVMGLTCLSGSYHWNECLAETFMWQKDGGAVAYIGASRESWDGSDNLFFKGGDNGTNSFRHIGYMRSLYHPMEEDESQLSRTIGEAFYIGKFADRFLGESQPFRQFMEFFTLFGDPTYQPYITVPKQMFVTPAANSVVAGHTIDITTAPEAVVCISQGRHIAAVGVADKEGKITLKLPVDAPVGECVLYASAPFYNDMKSTITVLEGDLEEDYFAPVAKLPHVQYADVIDVHNAASALPTGMEWLTYQPAAFGVGSPARYTMWAATNLVKGSSEYQYCNWEDKANDVIRGIFLRNKYNSCSFITTESAGKVAYVSVDWLNTNGQAEILGVYGKKTPYNSTAEAWNGSQGTKLGEIRKGQNDYLVLNEEWPYIMLRAEDLEGRNPEQNDVFIKSLTIGWNKLTAEQPIRELVVSDFGSTTLALEEPYTMPDGLKGQVVSARECSATPGSYELTLTTKYQGGDVVPAGECLVVKGEPGTYEVYAGQTSAKPSTYPVNLLRADYRPSGSKYLTDFYNYASAYERYYYYKLTTKGGQNFGWYYGAEDGAPFLMSSAERAYLVLDRQLAADVRGFSLEDCTEDMTTGVNVLNSGLLPSGNGVRYDLYGRRALDNRGGIVIENGRKVLK